MLTVEARGITIVAGIAESFVYNYFGATNTIFIMNRNAAKRSNSVAAVGLGLACVLGTVGAGWLCLLLAGMMGFSPEIPLTFMPGRAAAAVIWSAFFALLGGSLFLILSARTFTSAAKTVRKWAVGLWVAVAVMQLVWTLLMYRLQGYTIAFVWLGVTASLLSALIVLAFRLRPAAAFMLLPIAFWVLYSISAALYLVVNV